MQPPGIERREDGGDKARVIRRHHSQVIDEVCADDVGVGSVDCLAEEGAGMGRVE